MSDDVVVIRPSGAFAPLQLRETWRFRGLLGTLAARDVKLRYKQTALGVAWVVLQPLIGAAIFAFVFGRVADLPSGGVPYFLFALAGLVGWTLFSAAFTRVSLCLVGNTPLVQKVWFPRLVLPLAALPAAALDFAVALALLLVLLPFGGAATGAGALLAPLHALPLLLAALGVGLALGALAVQWRDVQHLLPVLNQLLLYVSPVAYGAAVVPEEVRPLFFLNPLAAPLEAFRAALLGTAPPPAWALGASLGATALLLAVGLLVFKRMERRFADVI